MRGLRNVLISTSLLEKQAWVLQRSNQSRDLKGHGYLHFHIVRNCGPGMISSETVG